MDASSTDGTVTTLADDDSVFYVGGIYTHHEAFESGFEFGCAALCEQPTPSEAREAPR